jgi:hypothetical protein
MDQCLLSINNNKNQLDKNKIIYVFIFFNPNIAKSFPQGLLKYNRCYLSVKWIHVTTLFLVSCKFSGIDGDGIKYVIY